MVIDGSVNDELWLVHGPLPLCADRVGVMPPAEDALVGASKARCGLHAPVRLDSVEGVLKITKRDSVSLHQNLGATSFSRLQLYRTLQLNKKSKLLVFSSQCLRTQSLINTYRNENAALNRATKRRVGRRG